MTVWWATSRDRDSIGRFYSRRRVQRHASLYAERSPDFFKSYATEGEESHILLASLPGQCEVSGVAALSYKHAFVNGSPETKLIGYLGSLESEAVGARALRDGYVAVRELAARKQAAQYLTLIMKDNYAAQKVLTSRRLGIPEYVARGSVTTLVCTADALRRLSRGGWMGLRAKEPASGDRESVNSFLNAVGPLWQAFPAYTFEDLIGQGMLHGVRSGDCILIEDRKGLRALGAIWDFAHLKRWRIRKGEGLQRLRSFFRELALRLSALPNIFSDHQRVLFLAARLVRPDDSEACVALFHEVAERMPRGAALCLCVHEEDPFCELLAELRAIRFKSELFSVNIHGSETLDGRPFYIEGGSL